MKIRIANRSKLEGYAQSRLPEFTEEEKKYIMGTSDFFCINTYYSFLVRNIAEPPIVKPAIMKNDVGVSTFYPDAIVSFFYFFGLTNNFKTVFTYMMR